MSSHTLPMLGLAVLALVVAVYGGFRARNALEERSAVKAAPNATAGALRAGQGPVELEGTAHAAEHTFTSPLTQQECVAYRFLKEEKQRKRDHHDDIHLGDDDDHHHDNQPEYEWVTIHDEESGAPFYVDDGSGRVLVDGATADLDMERSYEVDTDDVKQGVGEKVVASVSGLVGGGGGDEEDYEIPQQYVEELRNTSHGRRFKEWVVHEGEQVYVYGEAVSPEQTPMGSGVGGEMSATMGAMGSGGLVGVAKSLVGLGAEAATNPKTRYKPRAVKRLPDGGTSEAAGPDETQREELAQQAEEMQSQDLQENPNAAREMMDQVDDMMQQAGTAAEQALPDTPALDSESVVVSWGQRAPTFVVSDQGKGSVLRNYSTGVAKYALLSLVSVAVAVGAVAYGFGLI